MPGGRRGAFSDCPGDCSGKSSRRTEHLRRVLDRNDTGCWKESSEDTAEIAKAFTEQHHQGRQAGAERALEEARSLALRVEGRVQGASVDLQGRRTGPGGENLDHRVSGGEECKELPDIGSFVRPHPGFHDRDPCGRPARSFRFEERPQKQAELVDEQVDGMSAGTPGGRPGKGSARG